MRERTQVGRFEAWTLPDLQVLRGVCNHYLMSTAWADDPTQVDPGPVVIERRALCKRLLAEMDA